MVGSGKDESFFLKSPRELYLLFAGGEVTTSKPKPDPVPEIATEKVALAVKSASPTNTVVTNHPSWLEKLIHPFGHNFFLFGDAAAHDPSKDPNLVLLKAQVSIIRANVAGLDVANPISDLVELGQEVINNHVTFQLVSNDVDPGNISLALL